MDTETINGQLMWSMVRVKIRVGRGFCESTEGEDLLMILRLQVKEVMSQVWKRREEYSRQRKEFEQKNEKMGNTCTYRELLLFQ